jgi:hypothetical protein
MMGVRILKESTGNPTAAAEIEMWKIAKELHKTRARALRILSNQYWHVLVYVQFIALII